MDPATAATAETVMGDDGGDRRAIGGEAATNAEVIAGDNRDENEESGDVNGESGPAEDGMKSAGVNGGPPDVNEKEGEDAD